MRETVGVDYAAVITRLITWAEQRDDVRALVLNGSAATGTDHPLSDRDVEVFVTDPAALVDDDSWWSGLGEVLVVERLHDGSGDPTRLVYYVGGKLDFTIRSVAARCERRPAGPFQVLVDKDHTVPTPTPTPSRQAPQRLPPTPADLEESVHWAWAAALMCGKAIMRDEPWAAKLRDRDLKDELLRMIEWDHQLRYGDGVDTRFLGRGLRQWMDDDVQADLRHCWGRFGPEDARRALLATTDLYTRLAIHTAQRLGASAFDHRKVQAELHSILDSSRR